MTGLVILAAGESSRLGKPKQNIVYKGKSLLKHAISTAIHSACTPVIIILGARFEEIQSHIKEEPVIAYYNPQWQEGMSSSIRSGIELLQKTEPLVSEVILMVCDQPFVNSELLNDLISKKATAGKEIAACFYNNILGVPALFDKKLFPELLSLKGQEGAKKLLMKHIESVVAIPFPSGSIDIDTIEDYEALIS